MHGAFWDGTFDLGSFSLDLEADFPIVTESASEGIS
jgi:hypothetical protein